METFDYVIVGGGMTADAAVSGIRSQDPRGTIAVFGSERFPPYKRPPLSKDLWKGKPLERAFIRPAPPEGVREYLGEPVASLDSEGHVVTTASGARHGYRKLLIATGGEPKRLPFGEDVIYFRTMSDYLDLRARLRDGARRAVVVGGGFIGCEMAAALAMNECEVTMIFPEKALLERVLPEALARRVTEYYGEKGVRVLTGDVPTAIDRDPDGGYGKDPAPFTVRSRAGRAIPADVVVAGLGIRPNTELAEAAGIACDDGILVDERLQTSARDVFAAGDVARFPASGLGRSIRVEHEDNAKSQGRTAGENLAGAGRRYTHLPFFYSDLFDLGYEAVGDLDSRLEVFADWKREFEKGVVYYLSEDRVRGVLLWNVWDAVPKAEALIKTGDRYPGGRGLAGLI